MLRRLLVPALTLLTTATFGGAAELSLDRQAVQDLLRAATPATLDVTLPGGRALTLELGRPQQTTFVDGRVRTTLPIAHEASGLSVDLTLDFTPEIELLYGNPLLRARRAVVPALGVDVADRLPPVRLPRRTAWTLPADAAGGTELELTCYVQGIEVDDERLRVELGLQVGTTGAARAATTRR